jgi:hypothetical protein
MGSEPFAVRWQHGSWTRRQMWTLHVVLLSAVLTSLPRIADAASESTTWSQVPSLHRHVVDESSVQGRNEPASSGIPKKRRRWQQGSGSDTGADLGVPCEYECQQPCDFSCRVAHTVCAIGGTLEPVCVLSNASQSPVENHLAAHWTNMIDCTGGSILCDLLYTPSSDTSVWSFVSASRSAVWSSTRIPTTSNLG